MFRLRRAAAALSYEAERVLAAAGLRLVEFAALAALVDELRDILRRLEPPPPALGDLYRLGSPGARSVHDLSELDEWD